MSHYLIDLPARLVLLPVLLAQALYVSTSTRKLPEASGPRSGEAGTGAPLRLLILGDSSAAGVGAAHQDQALSGQLVSRLAQRHLVTWRLEAKTGNTTKDALAHLDRMTSEAFDLAVVALGVNDVIRAVPLELWLNRQKTLINRLKTEFGVTQIFLSGLPPIGAFPLLPHPLRWILGRQAKRFDQHLRGFAVASEGVTVTPLEFDLSVDYMAEDGFHPGPEVYSEWADMLVAQMDIATFTAKVPRPGHGTGNRPDDHSPDRRPA